MFSTIISDTFNLIGRAIGGTVDLVTETVSTVATDISNAPAALAEGFSQGFNSTPDEPTSETPVAPTTPVTSDEPAKMA